MLLLTPKSADYGVDILSLRGRRIRLIQCKHSIWGSRFDADIVTEMINAFDNYRLRWLRGIADLLLEPVLVTNGKLTRSAVILAKESDVQILDCDDFLRLAQHQPCTFAEIETMESLRSPSMNVVHSAVKDYLS